MPGPSQGCVDCQPAILYIRRTIEGCKNSLILPILGILKLANKAVSESPLVNVKTAVSRRINQWGSSHHLEREKKRIRATCWPSGLLSRPPPCDFMYGSLRVGCMHVSARPIMRLQTCEEVSPSWSWVVPGFGKMCCKLSGVYVHLQLGRGLWWV